MKTFLFFLTEAATHQQVWATLKSFGTVTRDDYCFILPDGTRTALRGSHEDTAIKALTLCGIPFDTRVNAKDNALDYVLNSGVVRYTTGGIRCDGGITDAQARVVVDICTTRQRDLYIDVFVGSKWQTTTIEWTRLTVDGIRNFVRSARP